MEEKAVTRSGDSSSHSGPSISGAGDVADEESGEHTAHPEELFRLLLEGEEVRGGHQPMPKLLSGFQCEESSQEMIIMHNAQALMALYHVWSVAYFDQAMPKFIMLYVGENIKLQ